LAGGLAATFAKIVESSQPQDAVILEASGVAEPHAVAQLALTNPTLGLNGVVTVVDAETLPYHMEDPRVGPTILRQVRAADLILLNKIDLVGSSMLAKAEDTIRQELPSARIIPTRQAAVPLEVVLGSISSRSRFFADHQDRHLEGYVSETMRIEGLLDGRLLCGFAESLPPGVLRAKGFVALAGAAPQLSVLQIVGRRWSLGTPEITTEGLASELVFIAHKGTCDWGELRYRLMSCKVM